jgi:hypothetical protein
LVVANFIGRIGSTDIVICNHEAGWVFSSGTRLPILVSTATASMGASL